MTQEQEEIPETIDDWIMATYQLLARGDPFKIFFYFSESWI